MEFENSSYLRLFLKAEKVSEFPILKSKLFHSMTVDGKKELLKECV